MGLRRWQGLMMIELPEPGCTTGGCRCFPLGSVVDDEAMSGLVEGRSVRRTLQCSIPHMVARTSVARTFIGSRLVHELS
jgi:hypothetical protein